MSQLANTFIELFSVNAGSLRATCRDVTEDESGIRPGNRQNPIHWLVGHVATYRAHVLERLDAPLDVGMELRRHFGKDTSPDGLAAAPRFTDVLAAFSRLHDGLSTRLREMGDEAFLVKTPVPGGRELPAVTFFYFHETYHIGQIGYARTWLGKPPLVAKGPVAGGP